MSTETTKVDDGGPAFPTQTAYPGYCGLSLRDYFAAAALPEAIRTLNANTGEDFSLGDESDRVLAAEDAYRMADAMLAARAAKGGR